MTSERIKEIQMTTAYPDSVSVQQALLQVWNECEQEHRANTSVSGMLLAFTEWQKKHKDSSYVDMFNVAEYLKVSNCRY